MIARIFDSCEIANLRDKQELSKWLLSDFPYKAEELVLEDAEKACLSGKESEFYDMLCDFRMLSLLMDKDPSLSEIKKLYRNEIPFKECNESKFSELDRHKFAALFFPLRTFGKQKDIPPSWGLVVKSESGKTLFFNAVTQKWSNSWNYENDGHSCRLAETLAEKFLADNVHDNIYTAAKEWIITGNVDESGNVKKVELGNKLKLTTKKKFMIPNGNVAGLTDEEKRKEIFSADSLTAAMNLITGKGVKPIVDREFPEEVDELHILVGAALSPQIASIVLVNAKKIVLWHSETSEVNADEVCDIAEQYRGIVPEKRELSSSSLLEAEASLKRYFNSHNISSRTRVIFNFTSGNRLMATAVQSIARLYHNVEMIYRDIDEKDRSREETESRMMIFNVLQYSEFPPLYGRIYGFVDEKLDVDFLRNAFRIRPKGNDGPRRTYQDGQDFYDQLIKKEE